MVTKWSPAVTRWPNLTRGPQYRHQALRAGMELPKAVGYGSDKAHWVDLGVAVNVAAWLQQPARRGEQFVESGVADELMGNAPRRSLNLRGHERPIDTLVLI